MVEALRNPIQEVNISLVGKYTQLHDAYISVVEALKHGGIAERATVNLNWVDSELLNDENAEEILAKFDVIVDASDNFPTRYLLSDTCMKLGKPDVYGAICEFAGQVTVFASDGPCLRCLCPEAEDPSGNPNSAAYGVLGVIPGMIGCMQAAEVLKLLLGKGEPLIGKMLFIDAKTWSTDLIEVPVHPQCSCHAHTKVHRT